MARSYGELGGGGHRRSPPHLDAAVGARGSSRRDEVVIETERLLLRKPRLEDADGAAEHLTDPEVMRFIGVGGATVPREACADVVRRWLDRWQANGGFGQFAVVRRADDRFLGRAGLLVWDSAGADGWGPSDLAEALEPQIELGWTLAREHWGNGYASEAARAIREWAFGELGLERLISIIHPDNVASQAVARRLGAEPTEEIRTTHGPAVLWVHPR